MKYKINIRYSTGNSFGNENTDDDLELEWDDLNIAKENLQYIKEHYTQNQELESYSFRRSKKTDQELFEENRLKPWFVEEVKHIDDHGNAVTQQEAVKYGYTGTRIDDYYASNCIKLKADNGDFIQIGAFWIGYFERLHGADIITDESDMGFNIN